MAKEKIEKEVEDTEQESEAKQNLRAVFAAFKEQSPKIYELKDKDAELEKKLAKL